MSDEELPVRDEVARAMPAHEAFALATSLYDRLVTRQTPETAGSIVSGREGAVFRQACELQLAGLNLLGGRDFAKPQAVVLSLACFTIDHLLLGWTAAMQAQPRVAATLSRAAVEASIFGVAATENFHGFERVWNSPKGTGGALLRSIRSLPADVKVMFEEVWKLAVPLGHASAIPVMSAHGTFLDGREKRVGVSFAGQYAGPMDANLLLNLARLYALASVAAVESMNVSLRPLFGDAGRWTASYDALKATLAVRTSIPKHLEGYMDQLLEMRRRSAGRPTKE